MVNGLPLRLPPAHCPLPPGPRYTFFMSQPVPRFAPPPRAVPLSLRLANAFNGATQFGWIFFGFGMIFVWVFGMNADLSFGDLAGQATAEVTQVEETGASENDQRIYKNYYAFSLAGQRHTGASYSRGSAATVGEKVEVEYDEDDPQLSRIAGMRRKMFGPFVLFVFIFPAVGALVVYFATRSGLRRSRLLQNGLLAAGTLKAKEPTNMTVNKRRVYELTFEFVTRDGRRCEAKARTTDTGRLEDEHQEPLLYDPENPETAYVLDEVPARPTLSPDGELEGRPIAAVLLLIIPLLSIIGHGLVAMRYFR